MITLACATTHGEVAFETETFLGRSLAALGPLRERWTLCIFHKNSTGLPELYNAALRESDPDQPLVLLHDDVSIQDVYFAAKLREALRQFDVVGIAGGSPPKHLGIWCDLKGRSWPMHGVAPHSRDDARDAELCPAKIMGYGPTPAPCEVVDGFFMAMRPRRILDAGACFDTRFRFHHYDIDFCWNARSRGLRVGTWPIWVVHSGSSGNFPADPTYAVSRQAYMEKYGA